MSDNVTRIAVVGLGNVGYWTTTALGLAMLGGLGGDCDIALVDFDTVDERAVRKGYPPWLLGCQKAKAMVAAIDAMYGASVSAAMHPVLAAAQSAPGLLADRDVFICVDSLGDAQFVSSRARSRWQCRVSTGAGGLATHCVEVFPPDTAALGDVYDDAAWSQAGRRQSCTTGQPARPLDGAAYPIGIVAGALAVQAYLNRAMDSAPYRLQWTGTQPLRSDLWGAAGKAAPCRDLGLDNRATIDRVWQDVARALEVDPDDLMLTWEAPIVRRHCACRSPYLGFERYPVTGRCPTCNGRSILVSASRELLPAEARAIRCRTLRSLHAPAGIGLGAVTRDGRSRRYRLTYRPEDVPPLTGNAACYQSAQSTEGLHA
ncbi:MAG: ThiF family adenylyltransferase [Deltaproteobacteria bacterium]|nr:ThiF family adenylyltransferase [Deltaproteobacteria bacterium]